MSDGFRLLHIRTLYDYSAWANGRVLDAAAFLTFDQLNAPGDGAYGSVRETLVHTMSAQRGWLARWQSTLPVVPPTGRLDPADFPDVAAIRGRWAQIEHSTRAYVADLSGEDLDRVVTYVSSSGRTWSYPLWLQLLHQVNHRTQHRSEVAALLTRYDRSPGDLDLLVFVDAIRE
jgi:uncharacterized damage-inducible protein DinB